jgi:hypothetical protein
MKANELRIGNWIRTSKEEQVVDVLCDSLSTINQHCITYDMVAPIPLTEEWFVRFGFEHEETEYSWFFHKDGVRLFFHNGVWNYSSLNTVIKSVHQLQNLYFALTGEELKINNQ